MGQKRVINILKNIKYGSFEAQLHTDERPCQWQGIIFGKIALKGQNFNPLTLNANLQFLIVISPSED